MNCERTRVALGDMACEDNQCEGDFQSVQCDNDDKVFAETTCQMLKSYVNINLGFLLIYISLPFLKESRKK